MNCGEDYTVATDVRGGPVLLADLKHDLTLQPGNRLVSWFDIEIDFCELTARERALRLFGLHRADEIGSLAHPRTHNQAAGAGEKAPGDDSSPHSYPIRGSTRRANGSFRV